MADILEPLTEGLDYLSQISGQFNYNHRMLTEISLEDEKLIARKASRAANSHLHSTIENELLGSSIEQPKPLSDAATGSPSGVIKLIDYVPASNKLLYAQGKTLFFCALDSLKEESVHFESRIVGIAHRNSQEIFVATDKGVYTRNSVKEAHEFNRLEIIGLSELLAGDRTITFMKYHKKLNLLYLGMQDLLLSVTPETGTANHLLDHDGVSISNLELISSQETLTALTNGYIYRWDVDGEFKGALQSSSCEVTQIRQFQVGGCQKGLVCCGSTLAVDVYLDFCHVATFLLR